MKIKLKTLKRLIRENLLLERTSSGGEFGTPEKLENEVKRRFKATYKEVYKKAGIANSAMVAPDSIKYNNIKVKVAMPYIDLYGPGIDIESFSNTLNTNIKKSLTGVGNLRRVIDGAFSSIAAKQPGYDGSIEEKGSLQGSGSGFKSSHLKDASWVYSTKFKKAKQVDVSANELSDFNEREIKDFEKRGYKRVKKTELETELGFPATDVKGTGYICRLSYTDGGDTGYVLICEDGHRGDWSTPFPIMGARLNSELEEGKGLFDDPKTFPGKIKAIMFNESLQDKN